MRKIIRVLAIILILLAIIAAVGYLWAALSTDNSLTARAIDFAKLGWLFLNGGKNGNQQVIPAAWVEEATRADDGEVLVEQGSQKYQHYWWIDHEKGGYNAEGNFCQFIYVYPPADLVLVRHGNECGGAYWTGLLGDIAQAVEAELDK